MRGGLTPSETPPPQAARAASALRVANNYDLLKCVALLAMTVDHLGFFQFPTEEWMRIIGRCAAPIFLLLVGFNGSFRFRIPLLIGACVVTFADGFIMGLWAPQNILWTILIVRWLMGRVIPHVRFHEAAIVCVLAIPLTMSFLDFGSFGLLFALVGNRMREKRDAQAFMWLVIGLVGFALYTCQVILAEVSGFEIGLLTLVLGGTAAALWRVDYLAPVRFMPRAIAVLSASALYYYVGHKVLLEAITLL